MSLFNLHKKPKQLISILIILALLNSWIIPVPGVYAQNLLGWPQIGSTVALSAPYIPTRLVGITIHPENPLKFDFIVNTGNSNLEGEAFSKESEKLIKYFLASLTVPEEELWVNLSPYEKNRVITNNFGHTVMGRDLLAQDYMLKQITASLMSPEDEVGAVFWDKIYSQMSTLQKEADLPIDTFHKVWIVPKKAVLYENKNVAYVVESELEVLLEEDYVALKNNSVGAYGHTPLQDDPKSSDITTTIIRETILPEIEREVNEGKNFAQLRQIYNSLILAAWFKRKLKQAIRNNQDSQQAPLLSSVYVDQGKVDGVAIKDKNEVEKIYQQYIESFQKGVGNYIREEYDSESQQIVHRKYFSGGAALDEVDETLSMKYKSDFGSDDFAMANDIPGENKNVSVLLEPTFEYYEDFAMLSKSDGVKFTEALTKNEIEKGMVEGILKKIGKKSNGKNIADSLVEVSKALNKIKIHKSVSGAVLLGLAGVRNPITRSKKFLDEELLAKMKEMYEKYNYCVDSNKDNDKYLKKIFSSLTKVSDPMSLMDRYFDLIQTLDETEKSYYKWFKMFILSWIAETNAPLMAVNNFVDNVDIVIRLMDAFEALTQKKHSKYMSWIASALILEDHGADILKEYEELYQIFRYMDPANAWIIKVFDVLSALNPQELYTGVQTFKRFVHMAMAVDGVTVMNGQPIAIITEVLEGGQLLKRISKSMNNEEYLRKLSVMENISSDEMIDLERDFVNHCRKKGIDYKTAKEIFSQLIQRSRSTRTIQRFEKLLDTFHKHGIYRRFSGFILQGLARTEKPYTQAEKFFDENLLKDIHKIQEEHLYYYESTSEEKRKYQFAENVFLSIAKDEDPHDLLKKYSNLAQFLRKGNKRINYKRWYVAMVLSTISQTSDPKVRMTRLRNNFESMKGLIDILDSLNDKQYNETVYYVVSLLGIKRFLAEVIDRYIELHDILNHAQTQRHIQKEIFERLLRINASGQLKTVDSVIQMAKVVFAIHSREYDTNVSIHDEILGVMEKWGQSQGKATQAVVLDYLRNKPTRDKLSVHKDFTHEEIADWHLQFLAKFSELGIKFVPAKKIFWRIAEKEHPKETIGKFLELAERLKKKEIPSRLSTVILDVLSKMDNPKEKAEILWDDTLLELIDELGTKFLGYYSKIDHEAHEDQFAQSIVESIFIHDNPVDLVKSYLELSEIVKARDKRHWYRALVLFAVSKTTDPKITADRYRTHFEKIREIENIFDELTNKKYTITAIWICLLLQVPDALPKLLQDYIDFHEVLKTSGIEKKERSKIISTCIKVDKSRQKKLIKNIKRLTEVLLTFKRIKVVKDVPKAILAHLEKQSPEESAAQYIGEQKKKYTALFDENLSFSEVIQLRENFFRQNVKGDLKGHILQVIFVNLLVAESPLKETLQAFGDLRRDLHTKEVNRVKSYLYRLSIKKNPLGAVQEFTRKGMPALIKEWEDCPGILQHEEELRPIVSSFFNDYDTDLLKKYIRISEKIKRFETSGYKHLISEMYPSILKIIASYDDPSEIASKFLDDFEDVSKFIESLGNTMTGRGSEITHEMLWWVFSFLLEEQEIRDLSIAYANDFIWIFEDEHNHLTVEGVQISKEIFLRFVQKPDPSEALIKAIDLNREFSNFAYGDVFSSMLDSISREDNPLAILTKLEKDDILIWVEILFGQIDVEKVKRSWGESLFIHWIQPFFLGISQHENPKVFIQNCLLLNQKLKKDLNNKDRLALIISLAAHTDNSHDLVAQALENMGEIKKIFAHLNAREIDFATEHFIRKMASFLQQSDFEEVLKVYLFILGLDVDVDMDNDDDKLRLNPDFMTSYDIPDSIEKLFRLLVEELENIPPHLKLEREIQFINSIAKYLLKSALEKPVKMEEQIHNIVRLLNIVHDNLPLCLDALTNSKISLESILKIKVNGKSGDEAPKDLFQILPLNNALTRILRMLGEDASTVGSFQEVVKHVVEAGQINELLEIIIKTAQRKKRHAPNEIAGILEILKTYIDSGELKKWDSNQWDLFEENIKEYYAHGLKVLTYKLFLYFIEHKEDAEKVTALREDIEKQLTYDIAWGEFKGLSDEFKEKYGLTTEDEIALIGKYIPLSNLTGKDYAATYEKIKKILAKKSDYADEVDLSLRTLWEFSEQQSVGIAYKGDAEQKKRLLDDLQSLVKVGMTTENISKENVEQYILSRLIQSQRLEAKSYHVTSDDLGVEEEFLRRWDTLINDTYRDEKSALILELEKQLGDDEKLHQKLESELTNLHNVSVQNLLKLFRPSKAFFNAIKEDDKEELKQAILKNWFVRIDREDLKDKQVLMDWYDRGKEAFGQKASQKTKIAKQRILDLMTQAFQETVEEYTSGAITLPKPDLPKMMFGRMNQTIADLSKRIKNTLSRFEHKEGGAKQSFFVGYFDDLLHQMEWMDSGVCTWSARPTQIKNGPHFGIIALKDMSGLLQGASQTQLLKVPVEGISNPTSEKGYRVLALTGINLHEGTIHLNRWKAFLSIVEGAYLSARKAGVVPVIVQDKEIRAQNDAGNLLIDRLEKMGYLNKASLTKKVKLSSGYSYKNVFVIDFPKDYQFMVKESQLESVLSYHEDQQRRSEKGIVLAHDLIEIYHNGELPVVQAREIASEVEKVLGSFPSRIVDDFTNKASIDNISYVIEIDTSLKESEVIKSERTIQLILGQDVLYKEGTFERLLLSEKISEMVAASILTDYQELKDSQSTNENAYLKLEIVKTILNHHNHLPLYYKVLADRNWKPEHYWEEVPEEQRQALLREYRQNLDKFKGVFAQWNIFLTVMNDSDLRFLVLGYVHTLLQGPMSREGLSDIIDSLRQLNVFERVSIARIRNVVKEYVLNGRAHIKLGDEITEKENFDHFDMTAQLSENRDNLGVAEFQSEFYEGIEFVFRTILPLPDEEIKEQMLALVELSLFEADDRIMRVRKIIKKFLIESIGQEAFDAFVQHLSADREETQITLDGVGDIPKELPLIDMGAESYDSAERQDWVRNLFPIPSEQRGDDSSPGEAYADESMSVIEKQTDVGGIDFTDRMLDVDIEGEIIEFKLPPNMEHLYDRPIKGFLPMIIEIKPVMNLPLFLGLDIPERYRGSNENQHTHHQAGSMSASEVVAQLSPSKPVEFHSD